MKKFGIKQKEAKNGSKAGRENNSFFNVKRSIIGAFGILFVSLAMSSVGHAAFTVKAENDEAIYDLKEDVQMWIAKADKPDCKEGHHILESSKEFVETAKLTQEQKENALAASKSIEISVRQACDSQVAQTSTSQPHVH